MAAHIKPFTLFRHGPSPNPFKVAIILEELGLPYRWENVEKSGLKTEPFISANPNGRVPALVDPNRDDFTLFESGAIIDYLIAEYDPEARLRPTEFREKHLARSWEHFQLGRRQRQAVRPPCRSGGSGAQEADHMSGRGGSGVRRMHHAATESRTRSER